jgi:hypothetical protein
MPNPGSFVSVPSDDLVSQFVETFLNFIGQIPTTDEQTSQEPVARARSIAGSAAAKAAIAAGALALPPGPLGWLTILPELLTV